jgi:hypothetical protein
MPKKIPIDVRFLRCQGEWERKQKFGFLAFFLHPFQTGRAGFKDIPGKNGTG